LTDYDKLFTYVWASKGLAKLGSIVAETLLRRQMFPRLAALETCVAETNFAARKQKMFLPEVKNIFVSRTQILRPKHMFPSLATVKTMLIGFQCRSHIKKCFLATASVLTTIKMADCEEIEAAYAQKKEAQCMRWQFCSLETGTQGNEMSRPSLGIAKLGIVFLRVILEIAFLCSF